MTNASLIIFAHLGISLRDRPGERQNHPLWPWVIRRAAVEMLQGNERRSSLAESEWSNNPISDPDIVSKSTVRRIRRPSSQDLGVRSWGLSDGAEDPSTECSGGSLSYGFNPDGVHLSIVRSLWRPKHHTYLTRTLPAQTDRCDRPPLHTYKRSRERLRASYAYRRSTVGASSACTGTRRLVSSPSSQTQPG